MKRRHIVRWALIGLLTAVLMPAPRYAAAAPAPPHQVTCSELNRNGKNEQLVLRCDFTGAGSATDRITVVDQNGSMGDVLAQTDWRELADFTDDVWIFDYRGDGKAELIIDYDQRDGRLLADLYAIPTGAEQVEYRLNDGHFALVGSPKPTVRVAAPDGWWTQDGQINFNLDITVDGLVDAAFSLYDKVKDVFKTDGVIDVEIHIRDSNNNGRPDYDWRTPALGGLPPAVARQTQRTFLAVNARDDEPPLAPTFPWPYMGNRSYGYLTSSAHQTSQPPIQIDWPSGTITAIGEFVSSRGNDGQWFVYSFTKLEAGRRNSPNFESPFAWYDLAADRDGQAELAVRIVHYAPRDPLILGGQFAKPVNQVRFSWDQNNDGYWDYKLGLLGAHPISSVVTLPELDMVLLPYAEIPDWVVKRAWGPASFVAAETRAIGEGIYEWDPPDWLIKGYFSGQALTPAPNNPRQATFDTIRAGYRGDYTYAIVERPTLYFSAIDRQLHLKSAQAGIWNINDRSTLKYADRDGDGYFDQWVYAASSGAETLQIADSHLLFSSGASVVIRQAKARMSLFEALPPANNEQWRGLEKLLDANRGDFAPDNLLGALRQFDGPETQITGAMISDYRPLNSGAFRFTIELRPGFRVQGADMLGVSGLSPGSYAVVYNQDGFTIEPLTAPQISARLISPTLRRLEPAMIHLALRNDGTQDLSGATIELELMSRIEQTTTVLSDSIDLLASEVITASLQWTPPADGMWTLTPRVRKPDGQVIPLKAERAIILAAQQPTAGATITASSSELALPLALAGMALFALLAMALFWKQLGNT